MRLCRPGWMRTRTRSGAVMGETAPQGQRDRPGVACERKRSTQSLTPGWIATEMICEDQQDQQGLPDLADQQARRPSLAPSTQIKSGNWCRQKWIG